MAITKSNVKTALLSKIQNTTTIYDPNSEYLVKIDALEGNESIVEDLLANLSSGVDQIIPHETESIPTELKYFVLCNQSAALSLRNGLSEQDEIEIRGKKVPFYIIVFEPVFGDKEVFFAYEKATPGEVGFKNLENVDLE